MDLSRYAESATVSLNQADPFGGSLIGDLLDAPISVPNDQSSANNYSADADLFAAATFVSASSTVQSTNSQKQTEGDLLASEKVVPPATSLAFDFFSSTDPVIHPQTQGIDPTPLGQSVDDPFATVLLNNFDGSDPFGAFTSSDTIPKGPSDNPTIDSMPSGMKNETLKSSGPQQKKDAFQIKSGIWADSLSRGLIDLNISAPKKVSLAEVGIVGGLSDASDERDKGPSTNFFMGRAMGTGSGLGRSGITPSQSTGEDDFSSFVSQPSQYNSLKN